MLGGSVLWGCYACCKLFVGDAFQRRTPFTQLNENDFGFQTGEGRGLRKQAYMVKSKVYSPRKKGQVVAEALYSKQLYQKHYLK